MPGCRAGKWFNESMTRVAILLLLPLLVRAQSVRGTVEDSAGATVPGALVQLDDRMSHSKLEVKTDSNGRYSFAAVPPGSYERTISYPGFQKDVMIVSLEAGSVVESKQTLQLIPRSGGCPAMTSEKLIWRAELIGQVRDPIGAAVPFAEVELHNRNTAGRIRTKADQHGMFAFSGVPAGLYGIGVHASSFTQTTATEVALVEGQQHIQDVRMQYAPGNLR